MGEQKYMFLNGKYIYVQKWQEYEPNMFLNDKNKQSTQRMLQGRHPSTHPMKEASSNLSEDTGNFGGVIDSPWPLPITDEIETLATSDEKVSRWHGRRWHAADAADAADATDAGTEDSPLPSLLESRKNISRKGNMFVNGKYKESTKKVPLGQGSHLSTHPMKEASSNLSEDTGSKSKESKWIEL